MSHINRTAALVIKELRWSSTFNLSGRRLCDSLRRLCCVLERRTCRQRFFMSTRPLIRFHKQRARWRRLPYFFPHKRHVGHQIPGQVPSVLLQSPDVRTPDFSGTGPRRHPKTDGEAVEKMISSGTWAASPLRPLRDKDVKDFSAIFLHQEVEIHLLKLWRLCLFIAQASSKISLLFMCHCARYKICCSASFSRRWKQSCEVVRLFGNVKYNMFLHLKRLAVWCGKISKVTLCAVNGAMRAVPTTNPGLALGKDTHRALMTVQDTLFFLCFLIYSTY